MKPTSLLKDQANELDFDSAVPLYFQLKELIKLKIQANEWRQGQMIASENEMAKAFEVSPGTVKKALSELVHEGILVRRQGKGTFVARPNFKKSFIRFFRFGTSQEGSFPESKVLLSQIGQANPEAYQALKMKPNEQTILIRRLRIMDGYPLMLEDIHLPLKIFKGFDKEDISQKLLYPIYDEKYQTPITWAEEFLEPRIADEKTAQALGIKPGEPVIFIERIAYTYGDEPVEYRTSVGRGDRFRYHIEIK